MDEILKTEFSEEFTKMMQNRMIASHYKYGYIAKTIELGVDTIANLKTRLELYEKTGNTEWLVDVANFAMIEFMFPQHEKSHFKATDSDESPGLKWKTNKG